MTIKYLSVAAIAAATILTSGITPANAGGRHHGFHKFHHFNNFHHHPRIRLYVGGGGNGCGYYYDMWQDTGSLYWKRKFFRCRNDY